MPNPPVPLERKRARGNPGKRALPALSETIAISKIGPAPLILGTSGVEAWNRITGSAPWLGESDAGLLTQLCEKIDRRDDMVAKLKDSDYTLFTDKGYVYSNPLVGMISSVETEIVKMMSLLGLTPTDRTRLGLAEVKAQSTLQKMREERNKR